MIVGSLLSPVPVFVIAALLLGVSIASFTFFIRVNKRNKREFDRRLAEYNKAVEQIKQQEEQNTKKVEVKKRTAASRNQESGIANSPRRIQFMAPDGASYDVPMIDSMSIGNNPRCDFCVKKTGVESIHCKITYSDGAYYTLDTGTASGTFFDGNRIAPNKLQEIKTGVLQLGHVTFFMTID